MKKIILSFILVTAFAIVSYSQTGKLGKKDLVATAKEYVQDNPTDSQAVTILAHEQVNINKPGPLSKSFIKYFSQNSTKFKQLVDNRRKKKKGKKKN